MSTFAPAADLVAQVAEQIESLEETLAEEGDFADSTDTIARDAASLTVIALALGLHDEDNPHKGNAAALIAASQALAQAGDLAAAKAALTAVKAAAASTETTAADLKWEKVASLAALMQKIPSLNTPLKSSLRTAARFAPKAESLAGKTATIAVIAHASVANADETEKPDAVEQWQTFCEQMRDAAAAYNAAAHAKDFAAAKAANDDLQASCTACHEVFHTEPEH